MIVCHNMPPGFVALQIYYLFYTLKMIDWKDHQFMNLFAKILMIAAAVILALPFLLEKRGRDLCKDSRSVLV